MKNKQRAKLREVAYIGAMAMEILNRGHKIADKKQVVPERWIYELYRLGRLLKR